MVAVAVDEASSNHPKLKPLPTKQPVQITSEETTNVSNERAKEEEEEDVAEEPPNEYEDVEDEEKQNETNVSENRKRKSFT